MDRQEAKPNRPSLLSNTPAPVSGPAPARILAGMEGRKEAPPPAAPRTRKFPLLAGAAALAALGLMVAGFVLLGEGDPIPVAPAPASPVATPAAPDHGAPATSIIVDAAPDETPFSTSESSAMAADEDRAFAEALAAATAPKPPSSAPAARAQARTREASSSTPRRAATPANAGADPDLLATLLKNIEQPAYARGGSEPSAMDDLVQQLRARDGRAADAPAQDVQALLRRCPRANTPKGLECRQAVCARFAGLDPACPAPQ